MPINQLHHTWFHQIRELRPGQRITQVVLDKLSSIGCKSAKMSVMGFL